MTNRIITAAADRFKSLFSALTFSTNNLPTQMGFGVSTMDLEEAFVILRHKALITQRAMEHGMREKPSAARAPHRRQFVMRDKASSLAQTL